MSLLNYQNERKKRLPEYKLLPKGFWIQCHQVSESEKQTTYQLSYYIEAQLHQIKYFLSATYSIFHVIIIIVIHNAKSPWSDSNSMLLALNSDIYH